MIQRSEVRRYDILIKVNMDARSEVGAVRYVAGRVQSKYMGAGALNQYGIV